MALSETRVSRHVHTYSEENVYAPESFASLTTSYPPRLPNSTKKEAICSHQDRGPRIGVGMANLPANLQNCQESIVGQPSNQSHRQRRGP